MNADPVSDLAKQWSNLLLENGRSTHTGRRYLQAVDRFITWFKQHRQASFLATELSFSDLQAYTAHLQKCASPNTVNLHISALRSFCNWLTEENIIDSNPAWRLKRIDSAQPLAPKVLKPSHVDALLQKAQLTRHAARNYAVIQVMVQTGLRINECSALQLGDLQISEQESWITVCPASSKSSRRLALNSAARCALVDYLALLWSVEASPKKIASELGRRSANEPLWYSQKGGALSSRTISELLEKLVAACSQQDLAPRHTTPHSLRHAFARNYLENHPGDLIGLAEKLGHSSLESTRIYFQTWSDDARQAI